VAIEIELETPGGIAADFDEAFAPVGIIQIEIVVVGHDRSVAAKLKADRGARQAVGAESQGLFLGDANEND
jgi:hypothetical protein